MSDQTNLTIGQLFEINQGKNPTQIADEEARARKAAQSLGLDYNKMTETPEELVSVADEINTQKQINEFVASDPVLGRYALDPNNAAVSLDDFQGLKQVSDKTSLLKPSLADPQKVVDYQDIQQLFAKGATQEQKEKLQKMGLYEDPATRIKPKVPNRLITSLDDPFFSSNLKKRKEDTKPQGGRYANAFTRGFYGFGATQWGYIYAGLNKIHLRDPLDQAVLGPGIQALSNFAESRVEAGRNIVEQHAQSKELQDTFEKVGEEIKASQGGEISKIAIGVRSLFKNASVADAGEILIEQLPPALLGFAVGSGAGNAVSLFAVRKTAKIAPWFMSLEKAAKVTKGVALAGSAVGGASGAYVADTSVSFSQNLSEARQKFLTRQDQIDYALAKTHGSSFYSGLGGLLLPLSFGGALRTVGGQAVIQAASGAASVYGAAYAVNEKADPLEVALEIGLGTLTTAPEVAIISAGKVRNQRTAQLAIEQIQQEQNIDAVKSITFASV